MGECRPTMYWGEAHLLAFFQSVSGHFCAGDILSHRKPERLSGTSRDKGSTGHLGTRHLILGDGQSESEVSIPRSTVRILPNHSFDPRENPNAKCLCPWAVWFLFLKNTSHILPFLVTKDRARLWPSVGKILIGNF